MNERDRFLELYAAYALGALDPADQAEFESLRARGLADPETDQLDEAVLLLAMTAAPAAPPADLRDRVLATSALGHGRRRLFRVAGLAAAAVLVAVAGFLLTRPTPSASESGEVVALGELGRVTFHARRAVVELDRADPPAGKDYELWRIRGGKPVSLGVLRGLRTEVRELKDGDALAVSLEPVGGARGGPPTKVVAVAKRP